MQFKVGNKQFDGVCLVDKNGKPIASTGTQNDRSGTITTGGASQQLMPANTNRKGYWLQNLSAAPLWINRFGSTADDSQPSIKIEAGDYFETPSFGCETTAVNIWGAATGQAFACGEIE